jgi:hypothetical protein
MEMLVTPAGTIRCLYDESLNLHALGQPQISRGSHLELASAGQWTADLSPVSSPILGPFPSRSLALKAEREWLEAHWLIPH